MKKILTAVLAASLLGAYAGAAEIKTNPQQECITVSGTVDKKAAVKEVSLSVLAPGKTVEDIVQGNENGAVVYMSQIKANVDRSFSVVIPIDSGSGIYTVITSYEGNDTEGAQQVRFVTAADNAASVNAFFESKNSDEMKKVLDEQWLTLSFTNSDYDLLDKTKLSEKLFAVKEEANSETKDWENAQKIFDKACMLEKISEGKLINIEGSFEILGIDKERADAKYIIKSGETFRTYFNGVMSGMSYVNLSEFSDKLTEATILSVVYTPDGNGEIRDMFKEYADKIGITNPTDDVKVYSKIAGKTYTDYAELANAYKKALNSGNTSSNSSSSSGGSSGGSSKKNTGSTIGIAAKPSEAGTYVTDEKTSVETIVFNDIDGVEWAKDAILTLYKKGIVSGKDEGVFAPNDPLTREQFVTMLVKAFNVTTDGTIDFNDVKPTDWFYDAVNAAYNNNIVRGYGDSFGVGEEITRQDMAVMVYNAIKDKEEFVGEDVIFADDSEISEYAKEAVYYLKNAGIINGVGDGRFEPKGINTRAQAAVVINNILSR